MTDTAHRALTRRDLRTLGLAALGGALEFYDFIIFVFFTAVLAQLFFPPDLPEWMRQLQALGIFAAGYLARPLGGVVMAHFGDRVGRKRIFVLSVLLMAVPTLLMGLLPTYADIGLAAPLLLLALRLIQGAAVGGEVPGAWVFVSEHVPSNRIGLACGTLTAGLTFGILLGSLVASAVNAWWSPQAVLAGAWRWPFVLGGVFGLCAMWLRRFLHETPVFESLRARRALSEGLPLREVLRGHGRAVLVSMLLTWMLTAGIVVVILMTPTLLQTLLAIPAADTARANSAATLALCVGCVVYGLAADRYGVRAVLIVGALVLIAATAMLYAGARAAPQYLIGLYAATGLCVGVVGAVPSAMVQAFPAPIRYSGISFAYNGAYAIAGGLTPLAVAFWLRSEPQAAVYYVAAAALAGLAAAVWGVPGRRDAAAAMR